MTPAEVGHLGAILISLEDVARYLEQGETNLAEAMLVKTRDSAWRLLKSADLGSIAAALVATQAGKPERTP